MKNKKSLYILIPLVIIIWGTVFWKIFLNSPYTPIDDLKDDLLELSPIITNKEEERILVLTYDDPFLGTRISVSQTKKEPILDPERSVFNRVALWPDIKYFGLVKNSKSEKSIALLEINQSKYFTSIGEEFNKIKCFFLNNDSIGLEFQNSQKYFKRFKSGYEYY